MKRNEFENVIKTLTQYYDKELDEGTREIYFNEMKYYNGDLSKYIEEVCNLCKFFPKIVELKNIKQKLEEQKEYVDINNPVCECNLCHGSGYRFINEQTESGYIYTFAVACDCPNGDNKLYDGRTIKDKKYRTNYICPRYSSVIPFKEELK